MMEELLHSSASETSVRRIVDCVVRHTVKPRPVDIRNKNFTDSQLEQLAVKRGACRIYLTSGEFKSVEYLQMEMTKLSKTSVKQ